MIDITVWMDGFLKALHDTFENRVWFVGLQGSYGRGEATETSDIDVVVILDELSAPDIQKYNAMLDAAVFFRERTSLSIGSLPTFFSFIMTRHQ